MSPEYNRQAVTLLQNEFKRVGLLSSHTVGTAMIQCYCTAVRSEWVASHGSTLVSLHFF